MRVWLMRLRTALAALAAVYLIWALPAALRDVTQPKSGAEVPASPIRVLRVWIAEDWTGSAAQWLGKQAAAYEKANRGTRVIVRRVQRGEWREAGAVPPDVLLFDAGAVANPEGLLAPMAPLPGMRPLLQSTGEWRGLTYAVPLCYGGTVRLANDALPDGPELTMTSDREWQEFIGERAGTLIATVREARKLAAREAAGKGFPFRAEPYGAETDKLLMAGVLWGDGEKIARAEAFVSFLLAREAQNALPGYGLLPASAEADPPDEAEQPLLSALEREILFAANAFD